MTLTKINTLKALVMAMTGTALSLNTLSEASAAATTMYNLTTYLGNDFSGNTTACAPCNPGVGTDGWVWGFNASYAPQGSTHSAAKWAGTDAPHTTPFGYNGGGIVNWALHMTSDGTAEISSQDSLTRYGVGADIDTAQGAWSDASQPGAFGRSHDLDYGLFKSDVGGTVILNAVPVNYTTATSTPNFGFTIFKSMDTSTVAYNHHGGAWNFNNNTQPGAPTRDSLPRGGTKFGEGSTTTEIAAASVANIVAYSIGGDNPSNLNTISFNTDPGQVYTIILGGYRNGDWIYTTDGYKLNVTAEGVPVPGAVWLFGSAMTGLIGFGRRGKNGFRL